LNQKSQAMQFLTQDKQKLRLKLNLKQQNVVLD